MTNMPINRFRQMLESTDSFEEYMEKLFTAFNPAAAQEVMCRSLVSVGYDMESSTTAISTRCCR